MEPVRADTEAAPSSQDAPAEQADYLVFELGESRYALPAAAVREVLPALEVDPLPGADSALLGVITLRGQMVPVLDTRAHLGMAPRPIELRDHFVVTESGGRLLVVPCDRVRGIQRLARNDDTEAEILLRSCGRLKSVVRDGDGLVLVPDLTGVLPEAEAA